MANGKTRRVSFAYEKGDIDNWLLKILDSRGRTAHAYPNDIIFPQDRGGKSIYEKNVVVPESLKSGEYKLNICGWLKDNTKLCQESAVFHIEGEQLKGKILK